MSGEEVDWVLPLFTNLHLWKKRIGITRTQPSHPATPEGVVVSGEGRGVGEGKTIVACTYKV